MKKFKEALGEVVLKYAIAIGIWLLIEKQIKK